MAVHIRLHPRPSTQYCSRGFTVVATDRDGFIAGDEPAKHGLFVRETRLLSHYLYLINGRRWRHVDSSTVEQHSWLGYYVASTDWIDAAGGPSLSADRFGIELRLERCLGNGMIEDVTLVNRSQQTCRFELTMEVAADFADLAEAGGKRRQRGEVSTTWSRDERRLSFDYHAAHAFEHLGERGKAEFRAANVIAIEESSSPPKYKGGALHFAVALAPREEWRARLRHIPYFGGEELTSPYPRGTRLLAAKGAWDQREREAKQAHAGLGTPGDQGLGALVTRAVERALSDLVSLRIFELDQGPHSWTMAAGLPGYVALFGRDTLWTARQAAAFCPGLMEGTLRVQAAWQGRSHNVWYEEAPGKVLHEAHSGPLSTLGFNNHLRSYSSITSSKFYCLTLAEEWRWTGDVQRVGRSLGPALGAMRWLLDEAMRDAKGFWCYAKQSPAGLKNQGWKDSDDAIVDEHGRVVADPISTCEEQAFSYQALHQMAFLLWTLGRRDEAADLSRRARELAARFEDAFWMEDAGFYALALGPKSEQVRTIASNPGHVLASGLVSMDRGRRVARRLMEPDLFSGWGIRTLSTENPAYNPFGYHLGSVWPVENGAFSRGFALYGEHELAARLVRGQFEAADLFDFSRLPEDFSGHERNDEHPFPAIYPDANWPQAWSSSAVLAHVMALLGIEPFAPLNVLAVAPRLPAWLPELTLSNMQVGKARVSLRFRRQAEGATACEVMQLEGPLKIVPRAIGRDMLTLPPQELDALLRSI